MQVAVLRKRVIDSALRKVSEVKTRISASSTRLTGAMRTRSRHARNNPPPRQSRTKTANETPGAFFQKSRAKDQATTRAVIQKRLGDVLIRASSTMGHRADRQGGGPAPDPRRARTF